jgi:predicted transcriptional regulator
MSQEAVRYLRETVAEIKADVKDIKRQQRDQDKATNDRMDAIHEKLHEHDKEFERQKWRHGFFGLLGGALSGFGIKIFP